MSIPSTLNYLPQHPPPRLRWQKWLVLSVLVIVSGFIAIRISDAIWSDWKRAAANRKFDQFQSVLKSIELPEGELAWSNDPADLTPEMRANPDYVIRGRVVSRRPSQLLSEYPLLQSMPLTVRRVSGWRSQTSGSGEISTWYAALGVDFTLYPALGSCSGSSTSFRRLPPPLDSAKTIRFWFPPKSEDGQDAVIPVEADGSRYRLVVSTPDNELRVDKVTE